MRSGRRRLLAWGGLNPTRKVQGIKRGDSLLTRFAFSPLPQRRRLWVGEGVRSDASDGSATRAALLERHFLTAPRHETHVLSLW